MNDENNYNHAQRSMLAEVENWLVGSYRDFVITKNPAKGFYTCHLHEDDGGFRVLLELSRDEAAFFDRYVMFPAHRADLEDLPRRLTVSKLLALIT